LISRSFCVFRSSSMFFHPFSLHYFSHSLSSSFLLSFLLCLIHYFLLSLLPSSFLSLFSSSTGSFHPFLFIPAFAPHFLRLSFHYPFHLLSFHPFLLSLLVASFFRCPYFFFLSSFPQFYPCILQTERERVERERQRQRERDRKIQRNTEKDKEKERLVGRHTKRWLVPVLVCACVCLNVRARLLRTCALVMRSGVCVCA